MGAIRGSHSAFLDGDGGRADSSLAESSTLFGALDDPWGLAGVLLYQGLLHRRRGELEAANGLLEECVALLRSSGDRWRLAELLGKLAEVRSHPFMAAKLATKAYLQASGLDHAILRPTMFMDTWLAFTVLVPLRNGAPGTVPGDGARRHSFVAAAGMAEFLFAAPTTRRRRTR